MPDAKTGAGSSSWPSKLILALAALLYLLEFLHLRADFPNASGWMDWSKMTDEGWYGGGAVHHFIQGSWYLTDSFNPAVVMPLWPTLLTVWFQLTGVSMLTARVLTLLLYGISLILLYAIVRKAVAGLISAPHARVAAACAVLLTTLNPFVYAFDRLAVLEPVMVFWLMVGLWLGSGMKPNNLTRQLLLGLVLCLLLLTKVTGVALFPAILYQAGASMGWPARKESSGYWLRPLGIILGTAAVPWLLYLWAVHHWHLTDDFHYLFQINALHIQVHTALRMVISTLHAGFMVGPILFPLTAAFVLLSLSWMRELWKIPAFGSAVMAMAGYLTFIWYHATIEPRYLLVIAMPMAVVVVISVSALLGRSAETRSAAPFSSPARRVLALSLVTLVVSMGAMGTKTLRFILHPEYTFWDAAQQIAAIVRSDPIANPVLLSDSGDDITLMTGLPALTDAYSVHGWDTLIDRYHPGWYAAWPSNIGAAMADIDRLADRSSLQEVARFRVFDDDRRRELVLYRIKPRDTLETR
jgi:4-amino-4-deoxy-L-arabinose transferase-like glycosyltransferase